MADHDTHDHTGIPGVGGSIDDILDIPTAEMDTGLVLHPDGAGGVEWGADATGGGGLTIGQAFPNPTSFTGDSDDMTSTAGWADVGANAWGTRAIVNSTILDLEASGASKACVARKTLGTTRAGTFDYRLSTAPLFTFWSSGLDVYAEWVLLTSGGTAVAAWRMSADNTINTQSDGIHLYVGVPGSYNGYRGMSWLSGEGGILRIARDGSNNITFWMGRGPVPMTLRPMIDTSTNAPAVRSDSGTVARVELRMTTPAGPGSTAYHHWHTDWFYDAS